MNLNEIIKKAKLTITSVTTWNDSQGERELKHWDAFRALVNKIEGEYIADTDYRGFPLLNENYHFLLEIYDSASDIEKRMIFNFMFSKWGSLFIHWKTDMDNKYGKGKWKKYFE